MNPVLSVLGTAADPATGPADPLAEADTVFTFPPRADDPESVALFYAEAWRVERVTPRDAVARVSAWAASRSAGAAVLLVSGDPAADAALGSVLDGLTRAVPELDVRVPAGARVAPPHRSPLIG
ncbi:hypothetical protein ACLFMI_12030 [Pseudonocardia nantongensis]|uniref:hypothetical protein n=1 Tax=Pseudonocardia nantongensis TaxID=1181885 RepID=UPI003979A896